jgi:cytochrome c oxidase subunit IV
MATAPHHADEHEEHHPTPMTYVKIATILTVITGIEVAVYYIEFLLDYIAPILIVLSGAKFAIVVGYYMHLKMDNKLFRNIFVFSLGVAAAVVISFMVLFLRFGNA